MRRYSANSSTTAWVFLTPTLIILFIFGLLPFIYVLVVSFFDWNIFSASGLFSWSGSDNWQKLVFDTAFFASLARSVIFTILSVAITITVGFLLALSLHKRLPGRAFFRTIHALPLTVAPIAVGAVWRLATIPGFGVVPYWLQKLGIDYNIGRYVTQAFATTVLMDTWHWTPFVTLTFIAGLSTIPQEPVEAAMVDGCSRFQTIFHIVLPIMKPVLLTILFIRIMDALRIVDEVWMLTGGGPGLSTRFVGIHIWRVVFPQTDYGYGSTISVFTLYFTIMIAWVLYTFIMKSQFLRKGN